MENVELYRERQTELIKTIEAIEEVLKSRGWQTLIDLVFSKRVVSIEKQLLNQAKADQPDLNILLRLQGELTWARRYSDLKSFADILKKELEGINKKLQ